MNFELSENKLTLLGTKGHILVLGGPGSGKTTIALLKANKIIKEGLKKDQFVLFLSFARATISRVEQHAKINLSNSIINQLEINTYHGFMWNLLKSHGYLLNRHYPFHLLPPPEAAAHLADIRDMSLREREKKRLFDDEGILHFDLFAELSTELLSKSKRLATIISDTYPTIILDEFQDTNSAEWNFIRILGKKSTLMSLADAEQRIYEFRGADPARIGEFINEFKPAQFDLGNENNRSNGTDIVNFGNDILSGTIKVDNYNDVHIHKYKFRKGNGVHLDLKFEVLKSIQRLKESEINDWSLAVLVPSKNLMLDVSTYLGSKQILNDHTKLPSIHHEVALETSGPSLSAILISGLLESMESDQNVSNNFIRDLNDHIRGRKGDIPPSKKQLVLSNSLLKYLEIGAITGKNCKNVIEASKKVVAEIRKINYSGNPGNDWIIVRDILLNSECDDIKQVALDSFYLRLLHKGATLNSSLANLWKDKYNYLGAKSAVREALLQEHFAASTKVWTGVHVMTMHKAKGKEFDEVIIYEGLYQGKILRRDADKKETDQSRLKLRVAVTRAIKRVTILTPKNDICPFLI